MRHAWIPSRPNADMLALQFSAERAGYALACPFSNSEELEAAEISRKIDAGCYGPKRQWRYVARAGIAVGLLAVALLICLI